MIQNSFCILFFIVSGWCQDISEISVHPFPVFFHFDNLQSSWNLNWKVDLRSQIRHLGYTNVKTFSKLGGTSRLMIVRPDMSSFYLGDLAATRPESFGNPGIFPSVLECHGKNVLECPGNCSIFLVSKMGSFFSQLQAAFKAFFVWNFWQKSEKCQKFHPKIAVKCQKVKKS